MNVNFEYYRIFYYVARYGNFTKAACALNNSQPNITRAINCLEHEINCTLFVRTNRGVYLTPEGERLYVRVSAAVKQLQLAEEELSDSLGLEHGNVSIGASETALNIFLLDKLKKFHMDYPGVRLKISSHSTPDAIRSVRSGEVDFALATTPVKLEEPLKEVRLKPFKDILVGGRTFDILANGRKNLQDLEKYPFICLGEQTTTYKFYHQLFSAQGVTMRPDMEVATTGQILSLVKSELGLAFVPGEMAEAALRQQEIVQIHLADEIPERYVCMIYDARRPMSVAAQKLKKILQETVITDNISEERQKKK